jgi:hypothetical protein
VVVVGISSSPFEGQRPLENRRLLARSTKARPGGATEDATKTGAYGGCRRTAQGGPYESAQGGTDDVRVLVEVLFLEGET